MDKQDHDCLVRIDERIKTVCEKIDRILDAIEKQNNRVRALEKWKHIQVGMFLLIGLILGVVRFW